MAEREVTDHKGNGFKLKSIVWRSPPSTSPLTGRSIRCVVGTDENGGFRVAHRTGRMGRENFEMVFARETYGSKNEAIGASREMKVDFIRSEAETYLQANNQHVNELFRVDSIEGWRTTTRAAKEPQSRPNAEFRYGSPDIKSLAWEGRLTETDEGRDIHGVVGRTHGGEFKAGLVTVYQEHGATGRVAETGISYKWQEKGYTEKEQAMFAARKEVQNQHTYDKAEPERLIPESGGRPAEQLLASATAPRTGKAKREAPAKDKSWTIDR